MKKCTIASCENISINKKTGFCPKHYTKWLRHGDPLYRVREQNKGLKCIAPSCEREQNTKHYCTNHYMKIKRTGTLEKINFTPEWGKRNAQARLSELSRIDATPSPNARRGYLATNTVADIKAKALNRGIEWTLTPVETYYLIIANCTYCDEPSNWPNGRNGIDRIENHLGYHIGNCMPCCTRCNTAKSQSTVREFKDWITKMYFKINKIE
jgi:hypothetical protein